LTDPRKEGSLRLLVLGLDSLDGDLMAPWLEAGELPNLRRLMEGGASGRLRSTVPYTTPPAWTSFTTGKNPGGHGVYDFTVLRPGTYNVHLSNGSYRRAGTVWRHLAGRGWRTAQINVPWTYPPEDLGASSFVMSGMDSPLFAPDVVSPREAFGEVKSVVGDFYYGPPRRGDDGSYTVGLLEAEIRRVTDLTRYAVERRASEAVMAVFTAADRVQHHFVGSRRAVAEDGRAFEDVVLHVYRTLDGAVGELLKLAGEETLVVVASDHGAGPIEGVVNLPAALESLGLSARGGAAGGRGALARLYDGAKGAVPDGVLRQAKRLVGERRHGLTGGMKALEFDPARSRAFASGATGVRVNLKGREPEGIVEPGAAYEAVRDGAIGGLGGLRDASGRPLVEGVYRREELYHGPALEDAPDLVVAPRTGVEFVRRSDGVLFPQSISWRGNLLEGNHRPEGILVMRGPGVAPGERVEGVRIEDVAPTVLHLLGEPVPEDYDGRVLAALGGAVATEYAESSGAADGYGEDEGEFGYSEADEEALAERLRNLGYIE